MPSASAARFIGNPSTARIEAIINLQLATELRPQQCGDDHPISPPGISHCAQRGTLIVLVQEQDLVLEVTVQQGRTEAIDGPTLQVDWTQLHCVMDLIINALVRTGTLPAEIVQTRERYVRGQKKGMDLVLELRLSESVEADALKKISAVAEHTLATMMRKPSERSWPTNRSSVIWIALAAAI